MAINFTAATQPIAAITTAAKAALPVAATTSSDAAYAQKILLAKQLNVKIAADKAAENVAEQKTESVTEPAGETLGTNFSVQA